MLIKSNIWVRIKRDRSFLKSQCSSFSTIVTSCEVRFRRISTKEFARDGKEEREELSRRRKGSEIVGGRGRGIRLRIVYREERRNKKNRQFYVPFFLPLLLSIAVIQSVREKYE